MNDKFEPANLLEISLVQASTDPAARPRFLRELLDSRIFIPAVGEPPPVVNGVIPKESKISMVNVEFEGRQWIPFFTSEARLPAGTKYLSFDSRVLFEMTKGACLLLNPGNAYGKGFYPEEIAALLDGSAFSARQPYIVKEGTQVLIGAPSDYPSELVAALKRLYAGRSEVKRAWLAFYHNPQRDAEGGLLIALDVPNAKAMELVSTESGLVIESIPRKHKFVDLIRYNGVEGVSAYFTRERPFYQRSLLKGFLKTFGG